MSEAWPTSAEVYNLFMSRPDPNAIFWGNRSPDYLREAIGAGRSTTNTTTTMQFSLGLEGELAERQRLLGYHDFDRPLGQPGQSERLGQAVVIAGTVPGTELWP